MSNKTFDRIMISGIILLTALWILAMVVLIWGVFKFDREIHKIGLKGVIEKIWEGPKKPSSFAPCFGRMTSQKSETQNTYSLV